MGSVFQARVLILRSLKHLSTELLKQMLLLNLFLLLLAQTKERRANTFYEYNPSIPKMFEKWHLPDVVLLHLQSLLLLHAPPLRSQFSPELL